MIQVAPPAPPDFPTVIVGQGPQPDWFQAMPAPALVMIVLAMVAGGVLLLWPLVRALARRLEGRSTPDPAVQAELEDLRARMHDLEIQQGRMGELEERLDFTERLLAQDRGQQQRLQRGEV